MGSSFRSLSVVNFFISLGFAMVDPFFPIYVKDIGGSGFHFAIIFSVFTIAKLVLSPWIGFCSDHVGRRSFIAIGLGLYVCVSLLYLCPPSVPLLIAARFLQGVAAAFFRTVIMALVGDQSPKEREGVNIATFDISFYGALALGPVVGAIVRTYFGMPGLFMVLAAITLVSLLLVPFLIPAGKGYAGQFPRLPIDRTALTRNRVFLGLLSFIFTRALGISIFTTFLPLFMEDNLGFSGIQIGVIMASGTVLMMVFLGPMGLLADHRSRRKLVLTGGLLAAILTFCLPFASGLWSLLSMTVVLGLGSVISLPASAAIVMEEGDHFGMGLIFGLFNTTMNLGFAAAPFLGNFIMDLKGLPVVFYCSGLIGIIGVAIFYICSNSHASMPLDMKAKISNQESANN
jgi:MFS transporter, DHA1 family, multidrug resistance protein